jgi:hypothetical protein
VTPRARLTGHTKAWAVVCVPPGHGDTYLMGDLLALRYRWKGAVSFVGVLNSLDHRGPRLTGDLRIVPVIRERVEENLSADTGARYSRRTLPLWHTP